MKNQNKQMAENSTWFLALIFILLAGVVTWAVLSLRVDVFTEAVKDGEIIALLITVDDGESPKIVEVALYHPVTQKGALIAIPYETGALLTSLDRVDRLEALYNPDNLEPYSEALSSLIGIPIDFTLRMESESFEHFVDHLGGVDIFIPNAIDNTIGSDRFLFPPGSVTLDGAKALSYIRYSPEGEAVSERSDREHRMIQALLRSIGRSGDYLLREDTFPEIDELIDSNMDRLALRSFFAETEFIDVERLVFQSVLGNKRVLEDQTVLFPYYDGKLIRETVGRINETLAREDAFSGDGLTITVSILNGTSVNGLASRTAQIFRSYGFRISSVQNADRSDYDRTVVLDRRGNPDAARRAAELIRCTQIHSQIDEIGDETVDVTIILGKDFDGRYVK